MSRNYRFHNKEAAYFVSFAVVRWEDVFTGNEYKNILIENLEYCIDNKGMVIFVWSRSFGMSNHVHLVFRVEDNAGNNTLETIENEGPAIKDGRTFNKNRITPGGILGDFKKITARKVIEAIAYNDRERRRECLLEIFRKAGKQKTNNPKNQFWRQDNRPIELRSPKVIQQKINYIHNNPVKAGLVANPEDYLYSSARDYNGEKGLIEGIEIIRFCEFLS